MKFDMRNFLLPLLAAISAVLLTAMYGLLKEPIAAQRLKAEQVPLFEILALPPTQQIVLDFSRDTDDSELLGLRAPRKIILARERGHVIALILPLTAREGYGGDIDLIASIDVDGTITQVRAIAHHESTGLGDNIERAKSAWITQFSGKSLANPAPEQWALKTDGGAFDQITGATVTSRAVVKAVKQSLQYFALHRADILQRATILQPTHRAQELSHD